MALRGGGLEVNDRHKEHGDDGGGRRGREVLMRLDVLHLEEEDDV
jgi:hypothetical protein